jgi:hypothetical protein
VKAFLYLSHDRCDFIIPMLRQGVWYRFKDFAIESIFARKYGLEREWRSVFDRDAVKALHQLYVISKLNFFSLNPLSMIHPLLLRRV